MKRSAVIPCIEEEYSLAPSWIWRHSKKWKPLLIYFRGPAGVPFFFAPILSLLGIWRFARVPRRLSDGNIVGAKIERVSAYLGSYGMGGPGFVGLLIRPQSSRRTWLVLSVWGAAEWITVDNLPCRDGYPFAAELEELETLHRQPLPQLKDLCGCTITNCKLEDRAFILTLRCGSNLRTLRLMADSPFLPHFRGSGEARIMPESDSLRDAVLLSKRARLWVD